MHPCALTSENRVFKLNEKDQQECEAKIESAFITCKFIEGHLLKFLNERWASGRKWFVKTRKLYRTADQQENVKEIFSWDQRIHDFKAELA